MTSSEPTAVQVQGWLDTVERQLGEVELRIEPLLVEQTRLQERRALLKDLLASFGDHPAAIEAARAAPSRPPGRESVRDRVHREVVDVFRQVGRPLYITELTDEYTRRGYKIPGQGKPANLSVHLSGWPDLASPERGVYGLASMFDTPVALSKRGNDQ